MMVWLLAAFALNVARAEFQVPSLTGPVVDQANMLSTRTQQGMENLLRQVQDSGGTQLQILTVPDLGGLSIEEASIKVTDQWKLGSAKEDNGVLLLVAAKERRVRIEVGQGREGVLPDITASRIIREVIVPGFRDGNSDRAITAGVFAILHYTDPKFADQRGEGVPEGQEDRKMPVGKKIEMIIWLIFILIFMIPSMFFRRRRGLMGLGGGTFLGGGGFGGGGFGGGGWGGGGGGFSGGGSSGGW